MSETVRVPIDPKKPGLGIVTHKSGPVLVFWPMNKEFSKAIQDLDEVLGKDELVKSLETEFKRGVCYLAEAFLQRLVE